MCRRAELRQPIDSDCDESGIREALRSDLDALSNAGVIPRLGDVRCLLAGHVAARVARKLTPGWPLSDPIEVRMEYVAAELMRHQAQIDVSDLAPEPVRNSS